MEEIWVDIKGFEGDYQVSNVGRVRSLDGFASDGRKRRGKILSLGNHSQGYCNVSLGGNSFYVHRLVAENFIENPENKPFVNHKNCNKKDNNIDNLEWSTESENQRHAIFNGLKPLGELHPKAKLTNDQVVFIKENYKPRDKQFSGAKLAEMFNVSTATISEIVNGFKRING
jgi:hypothetical protein